MKKTIKKSFSQAWDIPLSVQKTCVGQEAIIYEGKYLRFLKKGEWEYIQRAHLGGKIVIVVALTKENKVILVEQYRVPVKRKVIEFPAGLVSDHEHIKNESLASAAKRELLEETGYQAKKMVKLLEGPVSSGSSADKVTMFRAFDLKKVSQGGGDDMECIVVHEVALKQIDQWLTKMERKGYLIEPKVYAGLYFLKEISS